MILNGDFTFTPLYELCHTWFSGTVMTACGGSFLRSYRSDERIHNSDTFSQRRIRHELHHLERKKKQKSTDRNHIHRDHAPADSGCHW